MELIFFLSLLKGVGIIVTIPVAMKIWNRLGQSKQWRSSKEAVNDQGFWVQFVEEVQNE